MVTVFQFRVWDHAAGEMKTQPLKSPRERIDRVGGEIIEGTAENVPESALDTEGRYQPSAGGVGGESVGEFSVGGGDDISGAIGRTPIGGGLFGGGTFGEGTFAEAMDPKKITDPKLSPGARIGTFALNSAMFNEASNAPAELVRQRDAEFIARATSGATEPAWPAGTTLITGHQPAADTAPSFLSSGVTNNSTSSQPALAAEAIIREKPVEIEAMARELGHQFAQQAERLRGKNNRSKEEDELFDFLRLMATRLNELADAIKEAIASPAEEPIFLGKAAKIAADLETGFFEFVTKHRVHVWEVGAIGVALCFFSQLGLSPKEAADFLRQIIWPK